MKFRKKLSLITAAGLVLGLTLFAVDFLGNRPITSLLRPEYGEGDDTVDLQADLDGRTYSFSVDLEEIPLDEKEVQEQLKEAEAGLETVFLGGNSDCGHVYSNLNMPSSYPDSDITITWYLNSYDYVDRDGNIKIFELKEEQSVKVQAILKLESGEISWERTITLLPLKELTDEQKLQYAGTLIRNSQDNSEEKEVILPENIYGSEIVYRKRVNKRGLYVLLLTAAAVAALFAGRRQDEERERKKRTRELSIDYPEIVSRLSLYMGAGISTRNAWERIVENYEKKACKRMGERIAYEEMRKALFEMQSGISETAAYEHFGARAGLPSYLKLGTLLSQNARKGTRSLSVMLTEESKDAFEDRKALAKKIGEETESRLLLPMMLMLLAVLIMIMYPALTSFNM